MIDFAVHEEATAWAWWWSKASRRTSRSTVGSWKTDIPIGHKVALKDYRPGDTVIKYGVDIGRVVQPIARGEHLHVHNVKTKRW